ncbi:hypothetical protein [Sphingomonas oligophenolica]|nr:hypothetical protein [Sphingomonas oligophenolica]
MQTIDTHEFTDLGDAVIETRGSAMAGVVDPLGGFRQTAGFSAED